MSEEVVKELTVEEILEDGRKAYRENLQKRIEFFKSQKNEDINICYLYEDFKKFTGDFEYLLAQASEAAFRHLVYKFTGRLAGDVSHSMRFGDELQALYFMTKMVEFIEFLLDDIEKTAKYNLKKSQITVKFEPTMPVFFCDQCEENNIKRDSLYNWTPTEEGTGWKPKLVRDIK